MTPQVLVIAAALVLLALAAGAWLLSPGRRAARRARVLEQAEQAERMRHDPNGSADLEAVRWEAKRADTTRNFPGGMGGM